MLFSKLLGLAGGIYSYLASQASATSTPEPMVTGSSGSFAESALRFSNVILVVATDIYNAETVTLGLEGYGIPHQVLLVPQAGAEIPSLESSDTQGNFGGIVIVAEVGYQYEDGWYSALKDHQWTQMFQYQEKFGIRMVRLNVYPSIYSDPEMGVETAISGVGCCLGSQEQFVSITDDSQFKTANLKIKVDMSTVGLWHYPARIVNDSVAIEVAQFAPSGDFGSATTAAVINEFGKRQQMVWFMSWAIQWSQTSSYLQHSYIHWVTRGLFVGKRKTHLSAQIDDVHLSTGIYYPPGNIFRTRPADMQAHVDWQVDLNSRLPAGSKFFLEMAHNGNGDFISAINSTQGLISCKPAEAIYYPYPSETELEWVKPLGTGINLWDPKWTEYPWTVDCAKLDPLTAWFQVSANRDAFGHLSHTFSHEELNNATYYDADKEISWNQLWMAQVGIDKATEFSPGALVPPAITGLHNGDVIRAWMKNGLTNVVGDNTRVPLKNSESPFWPYYTTVESNGHAGLVVIPRYATTIYYNCDTAICTTTEWVDTSGGSGGFPALLADARVTNTRYLLGLHPDPYMFHQANMRHIDMEVHTVGPKTEKMSLVQIWVEEVAQEMVRMTNWPILSLKQDAIAQVFVDRHTLDLCKPSLNYVLSDTGESIVGAELTTKDNTCGVEVAVTVPVDAKTSGSAATRKDQVGSEPMILMNTMNGGPVTISLSEAVSISPVVVGGKRRRGSKRRYSE